MSAPTAAEARTRLGHLVAGRYRLLRVIGVGGNGAVYEAEHDVTGRRVAVKLLHRSARVSDDASVRFLREARAAATIGHPGFVEVLDAGRDADGELFLVLELLAGQNLMAAIRRGELAPRDSLRVACDVLDALAIAHARGFVHRDIKPENVFLARAVDGAVRTKVLDLGVVKRIGVSDLAPRLTNVGTVVGTPHYMSPEQARGLPIDGRADLWSVGALLFHALTGVPPYEGNNYNDLLARIIREAPPSLGSMRPDLPTQLVAVVDRALCPDLSRRWSSAGEMAAALRGCASLVEAADAVPATQLLRRSSLPEVPAMVSADATLPPFSAHATIAPDELPTPKIAVPVPPVRRTPPSPVRAPAAPARAPGSAALEASPRPASPPAGARPAGGVPAAPRARVGSGAGREAASPDVRAPRARAPRTWWSATRRLRTRVAKAFRRANGGRRVSAFTVALGVVMSLAVVFVVAAVVRALR